MANKDSNGSDDERNPFVAFRRFADQQISSALHGLADIPSAFGDLRKRLEEAESDAHKAWKRFNDSYERATSPERRQTEREPEEKRATPVAASVSPPDNLRPSMPEREDYSTWAEWHTEPWPSMRGAFDGFSQQRSWRPSLHFLFHNRYSPLRLESEYPLQDGKWRQAFEDLLLVDGGEHISQHKDSKDEASTESAADWLGRLAGRNLVRQGPFGAFMPRVDEVFQTPEDVFGRWPSPGFFTTFMPVVKDSEQAEQDSNPKEPHTELQLYEHFLGRQSAPSTHHQPRPGLESESRSNESKMPSIIATMTTTERRVLPDGTITTKTVLKKRFADGSEESEESTNTTHAPPKKEQLQQPVGMQPAIGEKAVEIGDAVEQSNRKSWFWSSS